MKQGFTVAICSVGEVKPLLLAHHYLSQKSKGFRSGVNVGLYKEGELVGCAIFTNFPVPEVVVGVFGLQRHEQQGMYELSRFCLSPSEEHNLASWFLAKAIKFLRANYAVRALLSYADTGYHLGTLYQAYGFNYYGLTAIKKDWKKDNAALANSRGCTGEGRWVPRTQKHRYLISYDKTLKVLWAQQPYPKRGTLDLVKLAETKLTNMLIL